MSSETFVDDFKNDFRFDAMVASLERFKTEKLAHPYDADFSYCIPTGNPPKVMRRQSYVLILGITAGVGLLICAFLGMAFDEQILQRYPIEKSSLYLILVGLMFAASSTCLVTGFKAHLVYRPLYKTRLNELKQTSTITQTTNMNIEDGETFQKQKIICEEFGFIGQDPHNKRIIIEGIIGRYLIRSQDLISLQEVSANNSHAAEICFRVTDTEVLKLALSKSDFKEQVIKYFNPRYCKSISDTLAATLNSNPVPENESLLAKHYRLKQERKTNPK